MDWIIAAIILPIPLFHLWLHALLLWWRKFPVLFYLWGLILWSGAFFWLPSLARLSSQIFTPGLLLGWIGAALMGLGLIAVLLSLLALGPKRYFMWAVLRPTSVRAVRLTRGPFRLFPHPAYFGYLAVALGNLLTTGALYLGVGLVFLLVTLPLVIWLEEEELRQRTG